MFSKRIAKAIYDALLEKLEYKPDLSRKEKLIWAISTLFWATIYIGFGVMMMIYMIPVIGGVLQGKTSSLSIAMFNDSITLPISTLCLPIAMNELQDEQVASKLTTERRISRYYLKYITNFFNQTNHKEIVNLFKLNEESVWPNAMIVVTGCYLAAITDLEMINKDRKGEHSNLYLIQYHNITGEYLNSTVYYYNSTGYAVCTLTSQAIDELEKQLIIHRIGVDELKQKFGRQVASLYSLDVKYTTNILSTMEGNSAVNVVLDRVSYVGTYSTFFHQICYRMRFDLYPFTKANEKIVVKVNRSTLPNRFFHRFLYMDLKVTLDIMGGDYISSYADGLQNIVVAEFNKPQFVSAAVEVLYRNLPVVDGIVRCSDIESFKDCKDECYYQIRNLCGCKPSSWPHTLAADTVNYDDCRLRTYKTCLNNSAYRNCEMNCLNLCENLKYMISNSYTPPQFCLANEEDCYMLNPEWVHIELAVPGLEYQIFEETLQWSFDSFSGAIGGIIGLWLGLDTYHMIISMTSTLFDAYLWVKGLNLLSEQKTASPRMKPENDETHDTQSQTDENSQSNLKDHQRRNKFDYIRDLLKIIDIDLNQQWTWKFTLRFTMEKASYFAFGVLTVVMCANLWNDYRTKNTVGEATPAFLISSMPKSNITICIPLRLEDTTVVGNNDTMLTEKDYRNQLKQSEIYLTDESADWTSALMHVIHLYIATMTELETQDYKSAALNNVGEEFATIQAFDECIINLSVSVDRLRRKFGQAVMRESPINGSFINQNYFVVTPQGQVRLSVSRISKRQLCYKANFEDVDFSYNGDSFLIHFDKRCSPIYNNNNFYYGCENKFFEDPIMVDFKGRDAVDPRLAGMVDSIVASPIYMPPRSSPLSVIVKVTGIFRSLPNIDGTERCSETQSLEDCQARCRITLIQQLCNCTPVTWPELVEPSANNDACTFTRYTKCLNFNITNNDAQCVRDCLPKCDRTVYQMKTEENTINAIQIKMSDNNYVEYEEKFKLSGEEFLGGIGGVIGLWLGLDFFYLIQVSLLFCAKILHFLWTLIRRKSCNKTDLLKRSDKEKVYPASSKTLRRAGILKAFTKIADIFEIDTSHIAKADIAKWIGEKAFWSLILAYFLFRTANMCVQLISDYQAALTISEYSLAFNNSITMPNVTICLPMRSNQLDILWNENWPCWSSSWEKPWNNTMYSEALSDIFDREAVTKEKFFSAETDWLFPVPFIAHVYLSLFALLECPSAYYIYSKTPSTDLDTADMNYIDEPSVDEINSFYMLTYMIDPSRTCNFNKFEKLARDVMDAVKIFENKMKEWNSTVDQLRQKLGNKIAKIYRFNIGKFTRKNGLLQQIGNIDVNRVTSVNQLFTCYSADISFTDSKQVVVVDAVGGYRARRLPAKFGSDYWKDFKTGIYVNILGRDSSSLNKELVMGGYMASSTSILCLQIDLDILDNWPQLCRATISIKGSFQSRQTDGSGNIICEQDEKVMMSCMAQCRARLLKDLCNCTPTSWPTIAPLSFNGEECTLTRYRTCLKFNISDESSCTDECHRLPPCNRVDYGLTQKNFPDFIGKEAGDFIGKGMRVELIIDSLTYSMFTEKLRYTTSDFIADLGGALGFYVGIDFPFLIEAFFALLSLVYTIWSRLKKYRLKMLQTAPTLPPREQKNEEQKVETASRRRKSVTTVRHS